MADDEIQEAPQAASGKSKMIIIVVVVVLLLGGAGAAAFFLLASPESSVTAEGEEAVVEEEVVVKAPAQYVKLKPITVNFTEKKKQRFVQISPSLMTRDPAMVLAIEENIPLIENSLLLLFSAQDFAELKTRAGQVKLREDALLEVQKLMKDEVGKEAVERVLFTGFIIQ
ncbi:MAG: flagellar basal body-associated FliL family protein [Pseudomonadales bacterium]|nr:flagellar basal body-associated FliL family protein [Pseudomonadales bacterium]